MTDFEYNESKFTELLLYVASRLAGDPSNGSIKRNKALFFADFNHYANRGAPITGATYVKYAFGPAPRGIKALEQKLIASGEAVDAVIGGGPSQRQKMLFPKREPDLTNFTGIEMATVSHVLDILRERTAMEASEISHTLFAWQIAAEGAEIPYASAFLYDCPITDADVNEGKVLLDRLRPELERVGAIPSA